MTLEEGIKLAESGDIGAMISLGDYYIQKKESADDIEKAAEWFEKAAEHKVVYAMHMTVLTKKIQAHGGLMVADKVEMGVAFALDEWQSVYEWAAEELECINNNVPGSENIKLADAIQNFEEASYYFALCSHCLGKDEQAVELVCDLNDVRSKILCAGARIQLAQTNSDYASAAKLLMSVIEDSSYAAAEKYAIEEEVYATAGIQLSMMHRLLINDLDAAVSVLKFMENNVHREKNIQKVKEELNRYQKKLFGGYKYV